TESLFMNSKAGLKFINMFGWVAGYFLAIAISTPFVGPICKVFTFPNRNFMLYSIDNVPVSFISFFTVRSSRYYHYGSLSHSNFSGSVLRYSNVKRPFFSGIRNDLPHH